MAKEATDRTTIDLFANESAGAAHEVILCPVASSLKVNKRNQIQRDKANGLKRIELKGVTRFV